MSPVRRARTYEKIKADLLAEAQAVGVHSKGAALDPVLELLINGYARELESIYDRVDQALEHNRRTLLRNYFNEPFLESPAQTVVGLRVKKRAGVGPGMRITWQRPSRGITPEYAVLGEREMVPLDLAAAFYCVGDSIYRMQWDESLKMTSTRYVPGGALSRPCLLLALSSPEDALDSGHLSFLLQPNDTGIPGVFPGSDPLQNFHGYLDAAIWHVADARGEFPVENILSPHAGEAGAAGADQWNRFPTEASFFARMESEHLCARMVHRFAPGIAPCSSPLPHQIEQIAAASEDLADVAALADKAAWLLVQLPYVAADDPRRLFSLIAVGARLAVGYRRDPRDRFNFTLNDYNVRSEVFEFGLADRPGQYCRSFGQWVVASLADQEGNEYPYVYDAFSRGNDRWFTLDAGADDVNLIIHMPRRKVPDVGYFDLYTGHLIGSRANTSRLDVLARLPANGLDFPEATNLRLLVPARGGGDGYASGRGGGDSLEGGAAEILKRQYARAAVWLRTADRLITMPDLKSYLYAMDARIRDVQAARASLQREGALVPGVRLTVRFDGSTRLPREEQEAICRMATRQMERRLPVGLWIEVRPAEVS